MHEIKEFPKFVRFLFNEHDLSATGLTMTHPQIAVLMLMDEHRDKPMSLISREVGLERSSFTRAADQLVKGGYVERKVSTKDRRVVFIIFTEKGNSTVKMIKNDWERYFKSLTAHLEAGEKKEFFNAVKTVSLYMNKIMVETYQQG